MAVDLPDSGKSSWVAAARAWCEPATFSRRKLATGAAALLALGVGYHVVFGANGLTVYEQKRQETHALETQMKELQRENDALKEHVTRLSDDPDAIEHQAREELHYTRPGEVIYALPSAPGEAQDLR